jgi:hypothetical protein
LFDRFKRLDGDKRGKFQTIKINLIEILKRARENRKGIRSNIIFYGLLAINLKISQSSREKCRFVRSPPDFDENNL